MSLAHALPEHGDDPSFTEVFTSALTGQPCAVLGLPDGPRILPMHVWRRDADPADDALVARCSGPTLDIGCGPGRMAAALLARGHVVLGIDVVLEAVDQTRARGVSALQCDVFGHVPGEGRWETALLADGNLGIGGDPQALLARVRALLGPGGRVVAEVEAPGVPTSTSSAVLECGGRRSRPFPWSLVGADDVARLADAAGLRLAYLGPLGPDRWCAVLEADAAR